MADARLKVARTTIEEARQQMEAERVEAAAFADQLSKELDASKEVAGLVERLETAESTMRVRADRAVAVADERNRMIDALRGELMQVRKDKDAEIAC